MEKTLLLGNGINNVGHSPYSWARLIRELIDFAARGSKVPAVRRISLEGGKPFTLLYEELIAIACCSERLDEARIKDFIAEKSTYLVSNPVYEAIGKLGIGHVLTTNYEGLLVEAFGGDFDGAPNEGVVNEAMYSVFRHRNIGGTRVWYVHGEATRPRSINLGYEHYVGQLQRMRNYLVTGTVYESLSIEPLAKRLKADPNHETLSWIDLFLTHDVHILGLTMDFVEIDLWWILTYRSRLMARRVSNPATAKGSYIPKNRVTYYIPGAFVKGAARKLEVLKALGVTVVPIGAGKDDTGYYVKAVRRIAGG